MWRGARPALNLILAVDVDGVLLDPDRGGLGPWGNALQEQLGIDPAALRDAFFVPCWQDIVTGRRAIEPALERALDQIGATASVEEVLACWFEADFVLQEDVLDAVRAWADAGVILVVATNQEHRRLVSLRERLGALLPLTAVIGSAELGVVKADDRFWTLAAERLGIVSTAGLPVLLDDGADNVAAARRSGWGGVHFTDRDGWISEVQQTLDERGRISR